MKLRALSLLLAILMLGTMFFMMGCKKHKAPMFAELDFTSVDPASCKETDSVTEYVRIKISIASSEAEERTAYEDIIIRLYPEVAPETVENFQNLVSKHFYDGLTFHRVIKGFMIQGGCPKGDGTGDAGQNIKGEFASNGFENNLKHVRGVVSMARGGYDNDSASCQFFIVHDTQGSTHLNGDYAAFGYVVSGMETVDAIANCAVGSANKPLRTVTIESIRFVDPQ